ncbi:MAG: hypothetical protein R2827_04755 [Bdellovibrionales bacterium]
MTANASNLLSGIGKPGGPAAGSRRTGTPGVIPGTVPLGDNIAQCPNLVAEN